MGSSSIMKTKKCLSSVVHFSTSVTGSYSIVTKPIKVKSEEQEFKPSIDQTINVEKIRNVGIIAHVDAGKTTTTERMLYYSGYSRFLGNVDEGSTVTDYMQQEIERGITITSAAITFPWNDFRINLIDTPGHVDFTIEVERSIRVLDGAVAIFDGVLGVEAQSKTVWKQASRYKVPRIAFVNKLDKIGADFYHVIKTMVNKLDCNPIPIQIPVGESDKLRGIIDLVTMEYLEWSKDGRDFTRSSIINNDELKKNIFIAPGIEKAIHERSNMLSLISDIDEEFADLYISAEDENDIPVEEIKKALRRITLSHTGVVVLCGSSLRNKGVQPLVDAITDYLPSPIEKDTPLGYNSETKRHLPVPLNDAAPLCALAFKVLIDPNRGPLVFIRVYSGILSSKSTVLNVRTGNRERVLKLYQMHANVPQEIEHISAGNIGVAVGLKETSTGDTLMQENLSIQKVVQLNTIDIPAPVFFCTIEPETSADQEVLDNALQNILKEDPSLQTSIDSETGQTIIKGMGELHLEIVKDRLLRDYKVECYMGKLQISYRECILENKMGTYIYEKKISSLKHYFAKLIISIQPGQRGAGNQVDLDLNIKMCEPTVEAISQHYEAIKKGCLSALMQGKLLGYPFQDILVTVHGGSMLQGKMDAINFTAFESCAQHLVTDLLLRLKASNGIQLLEPYMKVEITVDPSFSGQVLGDLSGARRARITSIDVIHNENVITAEAPLSCLVGYSSQLRSLTQGNAHYYMEFYRFEEMLENEQERIVSGIYQY